MTGASMRRFGAASALRILPAKVRSRLLAGAESNWLLPTRG